MMRLAGQVGPRFKASALLERGLAAWALLGGGIFVALAIMTVVSIARRSLFGSPVPGDFELVEIGTCVAVFMALPYAQISKAHVIVDLFTAPVAPRTRAMLDAAASFLFFLFAVLLTWRLAFGMSDFRSAAETTMILGLPRWPAFIVILPSGFLMAVACLATVVRDLRNGSNER